MKQNLKFGLVLDQLAVLKIYATFERFMSNQLTLFQSRGRGQIMLTTSLFAPSDFQTFLLPWGIKRKCRGNSENTIMKEFWENTQG